MSGAILAALRADGAWERANRELLAKLVGELTFEEVLVPEVRPTAPDRATIVLRLGELTIAGEARRRSLGHWRVDPGSLRAERAGERAPLPDAADAVALGAPAVGADPSTAAGLVVEVAATALSDAVQIHRGRPAAALVDADELDLEGELRGHPWIVAAKGRHGFDADDLEAFAPEARSPLRLGWIAVAAEQAQVAAVPGLDLATVVDDQLGSDEAMRLRDRAAAAGHDPSRCALVPVHPWQWRERIAGLHAGDLARGAISWLGEAAPRYLPRQSVRTLADVDHPERRELKLALSILNTSVYRGQPRARTLAAPALTRWLGDLCAADPFLRERGLGLLGEVASVSVAHPALEAIPDVPYQHVEMLGAIWREPIAARLDDGERALPLAALFHVDPTGTSLVELLVERSGLEVGAWVDRLHEATLPPLVHVLYRYGVAFSPHGQNALLVLRDDVPARLVVRDFVDDATICAEPLDELADLPAAVRAALGDGVEAPVITQWIQAGLLVCVHRYVAEVLADRCGLPEVAFWGSARGALRRYQERFADELADRFALFELDAPAFVKLCLNRVRILERGYRDAAERPVAAAVGWVVNPLAPVETAT